MKNTILMAIIALFFSFALNAQSTVDSITAKYQLQPMPQALTVEKAFPVLGNYQVTAGENQYNVVITLDADSKGIVWIEGLPEGKFKAFLKKSPTYYRIIAQKTEEGKQLPEGTLIYDQTANTLNIAFGKAYDDAEPAAVFAAASTASAEATVAATTKTSKSKSKAAKLTIYSGTKLIPQEQESTTENAAKENQEQKAPEQEQK